MTIPTTYPIPGVYLYSYPTFVDTPQQLCVHFVTPDQQQAFVSYPGARHKTAQLVPISWFQAVTMVKLDSQPQLMPFLEMILPKWFNTHPTKVIPLDSLAAERIRYEINELLVAFG